MFLSAALLVSLGSIAKYLERSVGQSTASEREGGMETCYVAKSQFQCTKSFPVLILVLA